MRFRLTYEGQLRPSQPATSQQPLSPKQQTLAQHKHRIRQHFHRQLERLWAVNKYLSEEKVDPAAFAFQRSASDTAARWGGNPITHAPLKDVIAEQHKKNGYRFVPLVRRSDFLLCSLSILFLRRQSAGRVYYGGDIDNRIKTLIDSLAMPQNDNQFPVVPPEERENPFFTLMEDDSLVSHLSVESDELLTPADQDEDPAMGKVQAIITVDIKPYHITNRSQMFL